MRINKNIVFKKLSVEEVEELYGVNNFKRPPQAISNSLVENVIILENGEMQIDVNKDKNLDAKLDEPKELKGQPVKRIYLEEVKEKMKDKKEASFKINGNHVSIKVDEETEIMVYNLEQRGTIFFRSETDTHFWEKPILKDKK